MKKVRGIISVITIIVTLLTTSMPVFAFSDNESRSIENFFIESQMLKGNGSSYGLDNLPTRMEGVIILIRLLGEEAEAQQMQSLPCRFTDVPAWAIGYANYAYAQEISKGVSDTKFGTNDLMTAQQYNTLLLRVIGYYDSLGDFRWDTAVDKADELEILPTDLVEQYEDSTTYTKRDLIQTSFYYLEAQFNNEETTLINKLIDADVISETLAGEYGLGIAQWDKITTNLGQDEYFNFDINNGILSITGTSNDTDKKWLLVQIKNKNTGAKKTEKIEQMDSNGQYDISMSISNLPKGEYYIDLYGNNEKYNYYTSFILSSLIMEITADDTFFAPAPVYGENLRIYKGNQVESKDESISLTTRASQESLEAIRNLAATITENCSSDYEKTLAIHDWVAENIYYDQDYLNGKTKSTNINSVSVLENRYAVCSGYANVTKDLISASGIPCKLVLGFALGVSEDEDNWEDVDLREVNPNHVWNEAYVDGRWVVIDSTWDSTNSYEGGKFTEGKGISHLYFDVTMQFMSISHKSIVYNVQ